MASSSRACSAAALSVPAGPCGIASRARHGAAGQRQRPHAAGTGTSRHRCRRSRRRPRSRACPAPGSASRPATPPSAAWSSRWSPRPRPPGPGAPARPSRARRPAAPPGAPGRARSASPRRPAPTPAATAAPTAPAPGPRPARSITSRIPRLRHQRHQHDHPDHERPGQQPLPLALHEPGVQRRPPGDPADHARPGLGVQPLLQRPQRRVMHRAALRPDLPVPLDLRLRDRDHLAEHDRVTRADLLRPPDDQRGPVPVRPAACPLLSGDASSPSGTATTIPPETGTAHDGTG